MRITIQFWTENAAFADGNEAAESARILESLAKRIRSDGIGSDGDYHTIRDANGNKIGDLSVEGDSIEESEEE